MASMQQQSPLPSLRLTAPVSLSTSKTLQASVGGAVAQTCEVIAVGHLLDRVKVYQQTAIQGSRTPSMKESVSSLYRYGGVAELYRGLSWNVLQGSMKGASRWCFLSISDWMCQSLVPEKVRTENAVAYSAAVGVITGTLESTLLTCPLESIKIWEMTKRTDRSVTSQLRSNPGMLLTGWSANFTKQTITWVTFLMAYEKMRQAAHTLRGGPLTMWDKISVSIGTGAIATLIQAPADLAKTLSQQAGAMKTRTGMVQGLRWVYRQHGLSGLFSGLEVKLIRHCTSTVIIVLTMDYLQCLPTSMRM